MLYTAHTEEYKNYTINIYSDDEVEAPTEWGNGEIFGCNERDLYISPEYAPENVTVEKLLELSKEYNLYTGDFGSHSGQWLRSYKILDANEIHKKALKECMGEDNEDTEGEALTRTLDNYVDSSIFVALPKEKNETEENKKQFIASFWQLMDDYIRGNVYAYVIEYDDDTVDSCGGFYGDYTEGALAEARSMVDSYTKEDEAKRLNDKAERLFLEAQKLSEKAKEILTK